MRRSRLLRTALAMPLLAGALLAMPADAATTPYEGCGGKQYVWASGTRHPCVFTDDFTGSTLDPSRWEVTETAVTGFRSGNECYVDHPDNVAVRDGELHLTATTVPQFACGVPGYQYWSSWTSGSVTTRHRFEMVRGRVQIRAAFASDVGPGVQSALWLWPTDSKRYGTWPRSGEIDIAEFYSSVPDRVFPYVHYQSKRPDRTATSGRCKVKTPDQLHTYTLTWTKWTMAIAVDGRTCLRNRWRPEAPLKAPAPFDQPFYLNLTQALARGVVPAETPVLPARMRIDSVYIWS